MARLTFPNDTSALRFTTSAVLYADPACTALADVQYIGGAPIPGSKIDADATGSLPLFLGPSGATVVYTRTPSGQVETLYPNVSGAASVNVTGSKGANAALTSLIAALVAQGLITDSTT